MNVLVTSVGQLPPSVRLELTVTVPQLSVAVASNVASAGTSARPSTVLLGGTVSVGAIVSCTVITCSLVVLLPQASVAMNVLVTSVGQLPPSVRLELTVTVPQLSVAVASNVASAGTSARHSTVLLGGTVSVGAIVSCTVITCCLVVLLPQASVAMYVLCTSFGQLPPSVRLELTVTVPQLSVAVASNVASAGTSARHSTVLLGGTVSVAAIVSCTVISCSLVVLLPQASVAM